MKFDRSGNKDDWLFVIALLLPAVFAGARFLESDRQMTQIAQAHAKHESVAKNSPVRVPVRVAEAERRGL